MLVTCAFLVETPEDQRKFMSDEKFSEAEPGLSEPPYLISVIQNTLKDYWRSNVKIMMVLLGFWAIAGLGCGVIFVDALNVFSLGGYPLGFWFAQQGSIIVFVILILIYALLLNRLETKYHTKIKALRKSARKDNT